MEEEYENPLNTPEVEVTPYDNEVTLLYKWAQAFQVPVQLVIVRPRTAKDVNIPSGTNTLVYESIIDMVARLSGAGETPAEIYDQILRYNKNITIDDVAMSYYIIDENRDDPNFYQTMNEIYANLDSTLTGDKFNNQSDLFAIYTSWNLNLQLRSQQDDTRLDSIYDIQDKLAEVDEQDRIPFSPAVINSTTTSFSPTLNGLPVTPEDGLDIFNDSIVSPYVPYIRYNDSFGQSYYRIYTGGRIENVPHYDATIPPDDKTDKKNAIYMRLWLGDPNSDGSADFQSAPADAFETVIYYLSNNHLTVKAPIESRRNIITNEFIAFQRAQNALPSILFGQGTERKVNGSFDIWGIDYDESSLLHMILNDNVLNVYLYVEENTKPYALKKRLDIHYRSIFTDENEGQTITTDAYISNSASVSVIFNKQITTEPREIEVIDYETQQITTALLPAGTPYIHVVVSQAESRQVIQDFFPTFQLLMRYYLDNRAEIDELYQQYFPGVRILSNLNRPLPDVPENQDLEPVLQETSKLERLRQRAPDIFLNDYSRSCVRQPTIINTEEEAQYWTDRGRQLMPYPPNEPRFYLVCTSDVAPYPGLKVNKLMNNRDQYPLIPCCYINDKMSEGATNSKYRNVIEGIPLDDIIGAKAGGGKLKTNKILQPGRIAYIPKSIEETLKQYSENYVDITRYGVPYSDNSLLHAVSIAIDDPQYLALDNFTDQEEYVRRVRAYMADSIHPSLMQQEMYDYTHDEIMALFSNPDEFFDPSLFYRAVEELYNINIYVFGDEVDKETNERLGNIDIPRFKIYHARPLRINRPTVIILKTMGSESDNLEHYHCELIVDVDDRGRTIVKLFGPNMTEVCHSTLQNTLSTLTWTVRNNRNLEAHSDIYYYLNHLEIINMPAVSQMVDKNGKLRSLTFDVNGTPITLATLPSQPENLPLSENISLATSDIATSIFPTPTGRTRDNNGRTTGLWFRVLDLTYGEYLPLVPTDQFTNLPVGPSNPLGTPGTNVTGRLRKLRRDLNFIKQLARWLYDISKQRVNTTPDWFANNYLAINSQAVTDSASYYDLSNLPRRLPAVTTVEQGIRELELYVNTLFAEVNGQPKMIMYNAEFADRVIKMLRDYDQLTYGLDPTPIDTLTGYYEKESDFNSIPNSKIFLSTSDLSAWRSTLVSSQNYSQFFSIRTRIERAMNSMMNPYLYQSPEGEIFLVQNVIGGDLSKAMAVAVTWRSNRVNIGSDPEPVLDLDNYMLYGLTPSAQIEPIEDHTNKQPDFVKLIYYGSYQDKLRGEDLTIGALLKML